MRALGAAVICVAAVVLGGCGTEGLTSEAADTSEGKALFREKCGGCHTLREAGTRGSNLAANPASGPNLDEAFAGPREDDFDESTIREVVRHQIDYPAPPMPADLVKGEEADAVAAYVAAVAANPEAKVAVSAGEDTNDTKALFETNCGSCHRLADAGTSGTVGPNLDQAKPTLAAARKQIANGGGGMPAFGGKLDEKQIADVAAFVSNPGG